MLPGEVQRARVSAIQARPHVPGDARINGEHLAQLVILVRHRCPCQTVPWFQAEFRSGGRGEPG